MHTIRKQQKGFSLIELMIVVAIVAILAAIAYPSYTQQVQASRRTEAKTLILEAQTLQERFFTQNNTYAANMTALGYGNNNQPTENGHYNVAITVPAPGVPAPSFLVTATIVSGAQMGDRCGNLSINSLGVQGISALAPVTVQECW